MRLLGLIFVATFLKSDTYNTVRNIGHRLTPFTRQLLTSTRRSAVHIVSETSAILIACHSQQLQPTSQRTSGHDCMTSMETQMRNVYLNAPAYWRKVLPPPQVPSGVPAK